MRSRIAGVTVRMKSFDFFLGIAIGDMLLCHSDNLSHTYSSAVQHMYQLLRTEESFTLLWSTTTWKTENLDASDPVLPRVKVSLYTYLSSCTYMQIRRVDLLCMPGLPTFHMLPTPLHTYTCICAHMIWPKYIAVDMYIQYAA